MDEKHHKKHSFYRYLLITFILLLITSFTIYAVQPTLPDDKYRDKYSYYKSHTQNSKKINPIATTKQSAPGVDNYFLQRDLPLTVSSAKVTVKISDALRDEAEMGGDFFRQYYRWLTVEPDSISLFSCNQVYPVTEMTVTLHNTSVGNEDTISQWLTPPSEGILADHGNYMLVLSYEEGIYNVDPLFSGYDTLSLDNMRYFDEDSVATIINPRTELMLLLEDSTDPGTSIGGQYTVVTYDNGVEVFEWSTTILCLQEPNTNKRGVLLNSENQFVGVTPDYFTLNNPDQLQYFSAVLTSSNGFMGINVDSDFLPAQRTPRPLPEFQVVTAGNVQTVVTNYGSYGDPNYSFTGRSSMEYPAGSDNHHLYDGALWIGAITCGDTSVSSYFYYSYEWKPSEGSSFLVGNEVPNPISNRDSYLEFDDLVPAYEHNPLGIKVIQQTYSWSRADYDDFLVIDYKIVNTGLCNDLQDLYVSWWFDCDVASSDYSAHHIDDLVAFDTTRQLSYMWDANYPRTPWDDTGEPYNHQQTNPGYIGQRLIYSPNGEVSSHTYWDWQTDPETDIEQYLYMSSNEFRAVPDSAFDWRWLQSVGPFDLASGDTMHLITGLVMGNGLQALQAHSDNMIAAYQNNWDVASLPNLPPAAPLHPVVLYDGTQTEIYITENVETDLLGYNIYRSASLSGPYSQLNSSTIENFPYVDNDPPEPPFYYEITAIDEAFFESEYSEVAPVLSAPSVIHIPVDYPTIQMGIDAAHLGDTVLVAPGTYVENISFNGKGIVVGSHFLTTGDTSYISQTIIDGDSSGAVVWFGVGEDNRSVLSGFTIQNGSRDYSPPYYNYNTGGIFCQSSSPTLNNLGVRGNHDSGIICHYNSNPIIVNTKITGNNSMTQMGGGINCISSDPVIMNVIISENYAIFGGGIFCSHSSPLLTNVTIVNNSISDWGISGLSVSGSSSNPIVSNCIVWNNIGGDSLQISNSVNVEYSNVERGYYGVGNLDVDPLFVDPGNGDYSLQSGSPCIDAGNPSPLFNDQDGSRNDMGYTGGTNLSTNFLEYYFDPIGITTVRDINEASIDWKLYNARNEPFTITTAVFNTNHFSLVDASFPLTVNPYSMMSLIVRFAPQAVGTHSDILTVYSPDLPGSNYFEIAFHGTGIELTTISGTISGVLSLEGSPYLVIGDIDIPDGDSLFINPGVELLFKDEFGLTVYGLLIAIGTEQDSIVFSLYDGSEASRWKGITFDNSDNRSILSYCSIKESYEAINCLSTSLEINNCIISDNVYGIVCNDASLSVKNNSLVQNSNSGIRLAYSFAIITRNDFQHNGVGIGCSQSSPIINKNSFYNNSRGIYCYRSAPSILNNTIILNGDGVYCSDNSSPSIINNLIAYNNATTEYNGIGIYCRWGSNPFILNNTITNNSNAGIYCRGNNPQYMNSPVIVNTIIWGNGTSFGFYVDENNPIISYSCIEDSIPMQGTDGGGNIYSYPQFADSANFDFNLQEGSPCIDVGTALFVFDGDTLVNLSPDDYLGNAPDMGKFESPYTAAVDDDLWIPEQFALYQNYPNPFNPITTIRYDLPKAGPVRLEVYNLLGQKVMTLVNGHMNAGSHRVRLDSAQLSSGIYFYTLETYEYRKTMKLIVLK